MSPATRKFSLIPLTLILLLGFGLRLWQLDARALWFDEGVSLTFAELPLSDHIHFSNLWQDTNPPAYKASLGLWLDVVGWSAFTTRLYSVMTGLIGIALAVRIARQMVGSKWVMTLSALLMSAAPMQVYYSREAKGYTFEQAFLLLVVVLWLRMVVSGRDRLVLRRGAVWVAVTVCTALAIGTHYMAALLLVPINLLTVAIFAQRLRSAVDRGRVLGAAGQWFSTQIVAAVVWVPWVLSTMPGTIAGTQTAAADGGLVPRGPLRFLVDMFLEFAGGPTGIDVWRIGLTVLVILAALIGLVRLSDRQTRTLIIVCVMGPVLLGYAAQTATPFFFPRFMLYVVPFLLILMSVGIADALGTNSRFGIVGLSSILMGLLIVGQYRLPSPRPDLRPLADAMAAGFEPGDALISSYSWQPGIMQAYLGDGADPVSYTSFFDDLDGEMQTILDRHGRVWLLTYRISAADPINDVGNWLLVHGATPEEVATEDSQIRLFVGPSLADNAGSPKTCETFDAEQIEVCFSPLEDVHVASPLVLNLTWTAREALPERYVTFVHVLAKDSPVPVAQQDTEPGNGLLPTFSWEPESPVIDLHAVTFPREMADGHYEVRIGLYDGDTLERVMVDGGGDSVLVGAFDYEAEGK